WFRICLLRSTASSQLRRSRSSFASRRSIAVRRSSAVGRPSCLKQSFFTSSHSWRRSAFIASRWNDLKSSLSFRKRQVRSKITAHPTREQITSGIIVKPPCLKISHMEGAFSPNIVIATIGPRPLRCQTAMRAFPSLIPFFALLAVGAGTVACTSRPEPLAPTKPVLPKLVKEGVSEIIVNARPPGTPAWRARLVRGKSGWEVAERSDDPGERDLADAALVDHLL